MHFTFFQYTNHAYVTTRHQKFQDAGRLLTGSCHRFYKHGRKKLLGLSTGYLAAALGGVVRTQQDENQSWLFPGKLPAIHMEARRRSKDVGERSFQSMLV